MHHLLGLLVADVSDTHGRCDLHQIWCQPLVEATCALLGVGNLGAVPCSVVGLWVQDGALCLQSRANQVEWVQQAGSQSSREGANDAGSQCTWQAVWVVLWQAKLLGIVLDDQGLAALEGAQIDSRVWEHAAQSHCKTTVAGVSEALSPHLVESLCDQLIAAQTVGLDIALHAELQGVNWVDNEPVDVSQCRNRERRQTYCANMPPRPPATNLDPGLIA